MVLASEQGSSSHLPATPTFKTQSTSAMSSMSNLVLPPPNFEDPFTDVAGSSTSISPASRNNEEISDSIDTDDGLELSNGETKVNMSPHIKWKGRVRANSMPSLNSPADIGTIQHVKWEGRKQDVPECERSDYEKCISRAGDQASCASNGNNDAPDEFYSCRSSPLHENLEKVCRDDELYYSVDDGEENVDLKGKEEPELASTSTEPFPNFNSGGDRAMDIVESPTSKPIQDPQKNKQSLEALFESSKIKQSTREGHGSLKTLGEIPSKSHTSVASSQSPPPLELENEAAIPCTSTIDTISTKEPEEKADASEIFRGLSPIPGTQQDNNDSTSPPSPPRTHQTPDAETAPPSPNRSTTPESFEDRLQASLMAACYLPRDERKAGEKPHPYPSDGGASTPFMPGRLGTVVEVLSARYSSDHVARDVLGEQIDDWIQNNPRFSRGHEDMPTDIEIYRHGNKRHTIEGYFPNQMVGDTDEAMVTNGSTTSQRSQRRKSLITRKLGSLKTRTRNLLGRIKDRK